MSELEYNIDKEYKDVVKEVTQKFGYNADLKRVLTGITKAVVSGKSYEDRQMFYETLRTTPIVVIPRDSHISKDEICDKMFGGDLNPHIKSKNVDRGEYDKTESEGSFASQPVFDENLNILGVRKFIFVKGFDVTQELSGKDKEYFDIFKTGINVSHLIHELGHAYASQKGQYTMDGNILTVRIGVHEMKKKFTPLGNGQYESENISIRGLFIEEGLNTNFEEETLAKYLGISLEEVKKMYGTVLKESLYQPALSTMTEKLRNSGFKNEIDEWRIRGNESSLEKINNTFAKTNFYEHRDLLYKRDKSIAPDAEGNMLVEKNRAFNGNHNLSEETLNILRELEKDFFADSSNMSPMDMLDNILMRYYNLGLKLAKLPLNKHIELFTLIRDEGYSYIYQAEQIRSAEKELQTGEK